jgi:hypothetical protein
MKLYCAISEPIPSFLPNAVNVPKQPDVIQSRLPVRVLNLIRLQ